MPFTVYTLCTYPRETKSLQSHLQCTGLYYWHHCGIGTSRTYSRSCSNL